MTQARAEQNGGSRPRLSALTIAVFKERNCKYMKPTVHLVFLKDFFDVDHFFKVFIEFVTILLLFYVLVFQPGGMWDPQPGIEPTPPALEGKVLTTGPPGKSPPWFIFKRVLSKKKKPEVM